MPMATQTMRRMPMATSDCPYWAALDEARSSRTKMQESESERESGRGRERCDNWPKGVQWILSNDDVSERRKKKDDIDDELEKDDDDEKEVVEEDIDDDDEESVLQHGVNIHVFVARNLAS